MAYTLKWDAPKGEPIQWGDEDYYDSVPVANSSLLSYSLASLLHRRIYRSKQSLHFLGINPPRRYKCTCTFPRHAYHCPKYKPGAREKCPLTELISHLEVNCEHHRDILDDGERSYGEDKDLYPAVRGLSNERARVERGKRGGGGDRGDAQRSGKIVEVGRFVEVYVPTRGTAAGTQRGRLEKKEVEVDVDSPRREVQLEDPGRDQWVRDNSDDVYVERVEGKKE